MSAQPTLEQINGMLRPSLKTFLLPWLAGDWIGSIMTGILLILAYRYAAVYPKKRDDRLIYRLVVAAIVICQVGQTTSDFHALWYFTVNCFGNDLCIRIAPTSEIVSYVFIILTNAVCQSYFAVRAVKMYENTVLRVLFSLITGAGVLFNMGSGFFSVVKLFQGRNFADADAVAAVFFSNRMAVWGYCGTDACIALLLIYKLLVTKRHTDFKETHALINRLMAYALGTTAIVFVFAAVSAGLSQIASAQNQVFIAFFMVIPRLYSLSVMFTLLTRKSNASHFPSAITASSHGGTSSTQSSPTQSSQYRNPFTGAKSEPVVINVKMDRTVHSDDDSFDSSEKKYQLPRIQHPYATPRMDA